MTQFGKIAIGGVVALVGGSYLAVESLQRARMDGNEASAIGSLRALNSGQATYAATQCAGGYASSFSSLAARNFVSPDMASDPVEKSGYVVTLTVPSTAKPGPMLEPPCETTVTEYRGTAVPKEPGTTGRRYFMTDQTGDVFEADNPGFVGAKKLE